MQRVYIVGFDLAMFQLFTNNGWRLTKKMGEADLVQLTGGEDINPAIYGQERHRTTYFNPDRDKREVEAFNQAVELNRPIAGICRGAQLINALVGGSMWQDVNNHRGGIHPVREVHTMEVYPCNSIHHQMMVPTEQAVIIATARESTVKENDSFSHVIENNNWEDPEVLVYPHVQALCFQGHPEYAPKNAYMVRKYFDYIDQFLFGKGCMSCVA